MQFSPLSDNHYATEALKKLLYNGMNIEILMKGCTSFTHGIYEFSTHKKEDNFQKHASKHVSPEDLYPVVVLSAGALLQISSRFSSWVC